MDRRNFFASCGATSAFLSRPFAEAKASTGGPLDSDLSVTNTWPWATPEGPQAGFQKWMAVSEHLPEDIVVELSARSHENSLVTARVWRGEKGPHKLGVNLPPHLGYFHSQFYRPTYDIATVPQEMEELFGVRLSDFEISCRYSAEVHIRLINAGLDTPRKGWVYH